MENNIKDFIDAVNKACEEHSEPIPEIVKNYKPGDCRLYREPIIRKWDVSIDGPEPTDNINEFEIF